MSLGLALAFLFGGPNAFAQPQPDPETMTDPPEDHYTPKWQGPQTKPPNTPPPVPDPSPVVLGGQPTDLGSAALPLTWHRKRFSAVDAVITGVGAGLTLASAIIRPISTARSGPVLFDEDVRSALREPTLSKRYTFRDASDVGLSLSVTWPFFIDALVTAWWHRGSRDAAEQMSLIDLETFAVVGAIQGVTNVIASRERPYGSTCGTGLPNDAFDCSGSGHYRSFFSGHTAFAFTGAALVCFQHFEHGLLGAPWDAVSCGGAYAVAAATSTFRMVADVHYVSDVLTGALVGTVVGYGVPLLHLKNPKAGSIRTNGATLRIVPAGLGAGVAGIF